MLIYGENNKVYDLSSGTVESVSGVDLLSKLQTGVQIEGVCIKDGKLEIYPHYLSNRVKLSIITGVKFDAYGSSMLDLLIKGNSLTGLIDLNLYLPLPVLRPNGCNYRVRLMDCSARLVFAEVLDSGKISPTVYCNSSTLDVSLLPEHVADRYIADNFKLVDDKCSLTTIFSKISSSILDNRLRVGTSRYNELLKSYVLLSLREALITDLRANKWLYDRYKADIVRYIELALQSGQRLRVLKGVCIDCKSIYSLRLNCNSAIVVSGDMDKMVEVVNFIYLFGKGVSSVIDVCFDTFLEDLGLKDLRL